MVLKVGYTAYVIVLYPLIPLSKWKMMEIIYLTDDEDFLELVNIVQMEGTFS